MSGILHVSLFLVDRILFILELSCLYKQNVNEGKGQPKKLHMEESERGELRGRQGGRQGLWFLIRCLSQHRMLDVLQLSSSGHITCTKNPPVSMKESMTMDANVVACFTSINTAPIKNPKPCSNQQSQAMVLEHSQRQSHLGVNSKRMPNILAKTISKSPKFTRGTTYDGHHPHPWIFNLTHLFNL